MARDPVCKMEIDEKTSPASKYQGKIYHFCCPSCKSLFDKNSTKYT